jgi:hypothetical protein
LSVLLLAVFMKTSLPPWENTRTREPVMRTIGRVWPKPAFVTSRPIQSFVPRRASRTMPGFREDLNFVFTTA